MNFQRGRAREELEINLIPMIDVLLVILIFLLVTTTYSKFAGLEINLPTADTSQTTEQANEINVVITASGDVLVNKVTVSGREISVIAAALSRHIGGAGSKDPVVIINADAKTPHQGVIDVMQAAQVAGLSHISFATQNPTR